MEWERGRVWALGLGLAQAPAHLEEAPRQRVGLVASEGLEEAWQERGAAELELGSLGVGDDCGGLAVVDPPHVTEGLVVPAWAKAAESATLARAWRQLTAGRPGTGLPPWERRAAQGRQRWLEMAQEPSWGTCQGGT